MKKSTNSYENLSDNDKKQIIQQHYNNEQKSFADIAGLYGTYTNKVRRDAIKLGINIRSKSEAQKNALNTGKHKHPTKGTTRSIETKDKIGMGVLQSWENLDSISLEQRKQKTKNHWNGMSEDEKNNLISVANQAARKASKVGSKLEKFLLEKLISDGYQVEFHKEQSLVTTKLQIDLFIPKINVAIEVDGPSHFFPVWGEDALLKSITYDKKKQGLILGKGLVLIRIKQTKDFSKSRGSLIYKDLLDIIRQVSNKFPDSDSRTFSIED
jgi:very-short-patch-repair endonuclease